MRLTGLLVLVLGVAAATPGFTQTESTPAPETPAEAAPAPGNDLSLGEPVTQEGGIGQPYAAETHGDWTVRCVRTEDGNDPCRLYQLLSDQNGNSVAEISIFPIEDGGQAVAGATIVTPLETLLTQQITLSVDGGAAKRYPFTFCAPVGCVARVGFTAEDVAAFRRGSAATMSIVPVAAPDQTVDLTISLSGFTAGLNAVDESN